VEVWDAGCLVAAGLLSDWVSWAVDSIAAQSATQATAEILVSQPNNESSQPGAGTL